MAKLEVVEIGDQGSALASGCDIGGAKVRNHWHTQSISEDSGLADLPGGRQLFTQERRGIPLVIDGLAVAADEMDPGDASR